MVVMAAADEAELVHMVATAAPMTAAPSRSATARRGRGRRHARTGRAAPIGRGRILREGERIAILSLGTRLAEALKAAEDLEARGLSTTWPTPASPSPSTRS
jgi:1-deoxy-D-xylulose-5-phosphate synthase